MKSEEPVNTNPSTIPRTIAFYVVFAAALYVVLILTYSLLAPILLSFILILLVTLAVNPIIIRLRIWTGGRKRAAGLLLMGVLVVLGLTIWASTVPMASAVSNLSEKLPGYWERLQKPLVKMEQKATISGKKMQEEVKEEIAREKAEEEDLDGVQDTDKPPPPPEPPELTEVHSQSDRGEGSIQSSLSGMLQGLVSQFRGLAFNTTQVLIILTTVFFGVIFTLMNPRPIFGALFSVMPESHHVRMLVIMQRIARFVPRWAVSVLISMLTIGSLFFLLMWPIFGFADALLLGLIAGLFSIIPFLGPVLSLIPALLLAIGEGGMTPVWVLLAYLFVQALESNVILPLIMSHSMKIHPVAVIFSMLLSVAAFGILGLLIAAPMVAIFGIVHDELYRTHFLPTVTDDDLDRLARSALLEKGRVKTG